MSTLNEIQIDELYKVVKLAVRKFKFSCQVEEELIQDTVIKCWEKYDTLKNKDSINAWAATIARNASIDNIRKAARCTTFSEMADDVNFEENLASKTYDLSQKYE